MVFYMPKNFLKIGQFNIWRQWALSPHLRSWPPPKRWLSNCEEGWVGYEICCHLISSRVHIWIFGDDKLVSHHKSWAWNWNPSHNITKSVTLSTTSLSLNHHLKQVNVLNPCPQGSLNDLKISKYMIQSFLEGLRVQKAL